MTEENKNFGIQEPKKKGRLFRIGLSLIIISCVMGTIHLLTIFLAFIFHSPDFGPGFVTLALFQLFGGPFLCLGTFLIFLDSFFQTKKIIRKIILIFLIFFVFTFPIQFILLSFSRFSPFTKLAVALKNESFCRIVILSHYKDECYRTMSELKQDSRLCEKIEGRSEERDFCYDNISKLKKDIDLCEKVNGSIYRGYCYYDLALIKKDPNICEKIEEYQSGTYSIPGNVSIRISDLCYEHLSLELRDHALCEKIENLEIRSDCYNNVKHRIW